MITSCHGTCSERPHRCCPSRTTQKKLRPRATLGIPKYYPQNCQIPGDPSQCMVHRAPEATPGLSVFEGFTLLTNRHTQTERKIDYATCVTMGRNFRCLQSCGLMSLTTSYRQYSFKPVMRRHHRGIVDTYGRNQDIIFDAQCITGLDSASGLGGLRKLDPRRSLIWFTTAVDRPSVSATGRPWTPVWCQWPGLHVRGPAVCLDAWQRHARSTVDDLLTEITGWLRPDETRRDETRLPGWLPPPGTTHRSAVTTSDQSTCLRHQSVLLHRETPNSWP